MTDEEMQKNYEADSRLAREISTKLIDVLDSFPDANVLVLELAILDMCCTVFSSIANHRGIENNAIGLKIFCDTLIKLVDKSNDK